MRASKDLFSLINSMKQTEKRYFKVYASKHVIGEKNNYVKLFEVIERQNEYDETSIRLKFRNEKFMKQLPVAKNYLYNLILKSLNSYNSEKSVSTRLNELIQSVEVLYKKSLYTQAEKILDKAKLIAEKYQKYPLMFEILHWKRKLISRKPHYNNMDMDFEEVFTCESDVIKKLSNLNVYAHFSGKSIVFSKKKLVLRTTGDEARILGILNDPLLSSEEKALSFEAKNLFYFVKILNSFKLGNLPEADNYLKKQIIFIESNPELLRENIEIYIRALINLLIIQKNIKDIPGLQETIKRLRAMSVTHQEYIYEDIKLTIFNSSYFVELSMYIETAKFEQALELLDFIIPEMKRLDNQLGSFRKSLFYFQFAKLYFITGNYIESIHWLNMILNDSSGNTSEDIQCHSRILNLIVHFELMNYDLIEYNLRSAYRYFAKKKQLYDFEKTILKTLSKAFRIKTDQELLQLFISLRKELISLSRNTFDKGLIGELNLVEWLECKIEKKNFTEILKLKKY